MLINIPIVFYSSALLLALHVLETETASSSSMPSSSSSSSLSLLLLFWNLLPVLKVSCWIPIVVTLWVILWDHLPRQWYNTTNASANNKLYDSDGETLQSSSSNNNNSSYLPFDPDLEFCTEDEHSLKLLDIDIKKIARTDPDAAVALARYFLSSTTAPLPPSENASWALVTGASKGIGRSICVSLARRKIPLVVVARDASELEKLALELQRSYGVCVIPMPCDLTEPKAIDALIETLATTIAPTSTSTTINSDDNGNGNNRINDDSTPKLKLIDTIDILINNAGVGDSCCFFGGDDDNNDATIDRMENTMRLNVFGTTMLTQAIGRAMKENAAARFRNRRQHNGGRIVVVSSVSAVLPGVPGFAVYAATKAYQRSLCASLGRELESRPGTTNTRTITVTCVMPGAVVDTGFSNTANMTSALIFRYLPGLFGLRSRDVAEATVKAAISGTRAEVDVGRMYALQRLFVSKMVPDRASLLIGELTMTNVDEPWGILGWWSRTSGKATATSRKND